MSFFLYLQYNITYLQYTLVCTSHWQKRRKKDHTFFRCRPFHRTSWAPGFAYPLPTPIRVWVDRQPNPSNNRKKKPRSPVSTRNRRPKPARDGRRNTTLPRPSRRRTRRRTRSNRTVSAARRSSAFRCRWSGRTRGRPPPTPRPRRSSTCSCLGRARGLWTDTRPIFVARQSSRADPTGPRTRSPFQSSAGRTARFSAENVRVLNSNGLFFSLRTAVFELVVCYRDPCATKGFRPGLT